MEIAVISGKGGTGKSGISAALATMDRQVVVADCDVDASNLYLLFHPEIETGSIYVSGYKASVDISLCNNCGTCVEYCRFDAIITDNDRITFAERECEGCFLCSNVCPRQAIVMQRSDKSRMYSGTFRNGKMVYGILAPGEENSGRLVSMVRDEARRVSKESDMEMIILDGPPGIGCPVISTITGTDYIVIVTEPTLSGLADLERVYEIACRFSGQKGVIINKYDLNVDVSNRISLWCSEKGVDVIGKLPFDTAMVKAMIAGKSITELCPQSEISHLLNNIWNNITHRKDEYTI